MADAIKSVVVSIETHLDAAALDKLTAGLDKSDKVAQNVKRQLEAVNTTLKNVSNRDITLKGGAKNVKELQDLRVALLATAKEYNNLSKEQKETLVELLNTNEQVIKSLEEGNEAVLKSKGGMEGYLRAINVLTPVLGQHGVAISLVVSNYLEYAEAANRGQAASSNLGSVLTLLRNKYVLLTGAILGFIGVGADQYFNKTDEGADLLSRKLEGLKQVAREAGTAIFGSLVFALETARLNFADAEKASDLVGQSVRRIFSGEAKKAGEDYADLLDNLGNKTTTLELTIASLNSELAREREIISEQATTFEDIIKQQTAFANFRSKNAQVAEKEVELANEQLAVEIKRVALLSGGKITEERIKQGIATKDLSFLNDEYQKSLVRAFQELQRVNAQEANRERLENRIGKQIEANRKNLEQEFKTLTEGFTELGKQIELSDPFNLSKLVRDDDKILAQDRLNKAFKEISDQIKRQSELLGVENILTLTPAQISELERKYNLVGGTIFNSILRGLESQGSIVDAIFDIGSRDTPQATEKLVKNITSVLPDITKQIGEAVENTKLENQPQQEKASLFERFFAVTPEQKEQVKAAFQEAKTQIIDAANTFIDAEIRKTDFLISEQERRIDEVNKLASLGNAEQLQLEQERLNNLLNERRKFEEQQAAINAAAAISATAVTAANFAASLTKDAFQTTPILAIANSIALLATIAAGIAQISALSQGFAEGTESVQPKGQGQRAPSDTVPAWLTPGERVVPLEINKALQGISNDQLPRYVALGKMMEQGYSTQINFGSNNEAVALLKEQNELLKQNTRAISDQIVDIQFDHDGMIINQRKVKRHQEKVRALVR